MPDQAFKLALLTVDRVRARELVQQELQKNSAQNLVERIIVPALEEIGQGWEQGTVSLSQVYMSGRICEELVGILLPAGERIRKKQPPMAIAVMDDYHQLGKRIVYAAIRSAGFQLADYGRTNPDQLYKAINEDNIELLFVSSLMLRSALQISTLTAQCARAGLPTKIIVGGAPFRFDQQLWQEVGAAAMGRSSSDALALARRFGEGGHG